MEAAAKLAEDFLSKAADTAASTAGAVAQCKNDRKQLDFKMVKANLHFYGSEKELDRVRASADIASASSDKKTNDLRIAEKEAILKEKDAILKELTARGCPDRVEYVYHNHTRNAAFLHTITDANLSLGSFDSSNDVVGLYNTLQQCLHTVTQTATAAAAAAATTATTTTTTPAKSSSSPPGQQTFIKNLRTEIIKLVQPEADKGRIYQSVGRVETEIKIKEDKMGSVMRALRISSDSKSRRHNDKDWEAPLKTEFYMICNSAARNIMEELIVKAQWKLTEESKLHNVPWTHEVGILYLIEEKAVSIYIISVLVETLIKTTSMHRYSTTFAFGIIECALKRDSANNLCVIKASTPASASAPVALSNAVTSSSASAVVSIAVPSTPLLSASQPPAPVPLLSSAPASVPAPTAAAAGAITAAASASSSSSSSLAAVSASALDAKKCKTPLLALASPSSPLTQPPAPVPSLSSAPASFPAASRDSNGGAAAGATTTSSASSSSSSLSASTSLTRAAAVPLSSSTSLPAALAAAKVTNGGAAAAAAGATTAVFASSPSSLSAAASSALDETPPEESPSSTLIQPAPVPSLLSAPVSVLAASAVTAASSISATLTSHVALPYTDTTGKASSLASPSSPSTQVPARVPLLSAGPVTDDFRDIAAEMGEVLDEDDKLASSKSSIPPSTTSTTCPVVDGVNDIAAEMEEALATSLSTPPLASPSSTPTTSPVVDGVNDIAAEMEEALATELAIAVLPFHIDFDEPDAEYLGEGLAESLIHRLSQLSRLKVSPISSTFRFKGKTIDQIKAGHDLDVRAVMIGCIARRCDNFSISVELIDVRNKASLWEGKYDCKQSELLIIQQEMTVEVTRRLQLKLSSEDTKLLAKCYTDNNDACELYLRARFQYAKRGGSDNVARAITSFEQTIAFDPSFALAYVDLANTYCIAAEFSYRPAGEALRLAREAATRALQIDINLAEAHAANASAAAMNWQWGDAERGFCRALELNPDVAEIRRRYAVQCLLPQGHTDEAIAQLDRALELDPLSVLNIALMTRAYLQDDRKEQALEQAKKACTKDATNPVACWWLCRALIANGKNDEVLARLELEKDNRFLRFERAMVYAKIGLRDAAMNAMEGQQGIGTEYLRALVYTILDKRDAAFAALDLAVTAREFHVTYINVERDFSALRGDARFRALLKRIGLPH